MFSVYRYSFHYLIINISTTLNWFNPSTFTIHFFSIRATNMLSGMIGNEFNLWKSRSPHQCDKACGTRGNTPKLTRANSIKHQVANIMIIITTLSYSYLLYVVLHNTDSILNYKYHNQCLKHKNIYIIYVLYFFIFQVIKIILHFSRSDFV